MATDTEIFRQLDVFWTKDDGGGAISVPGVDNIGNRRPTVKGRKTKEIKATKPRHQILVENLSPKIRPPSPPKSSEMIHDVEKVEKHVNGVHIPRQHQGGPSLKDLCLEDKKRVANLIKEIAKLNDEKETVLNCRQREREDYEKTVDSLVHEKEDILTERQRVESQLVECQHLVTEYQKKILEQQDRIAAMINEALTPRRSSTPESPPGERAPPDDVTRRAHEMSHARKLADFYSPSRVRSPGAAPPSTRRSDYDVIAERYNIYPCPRGYGLSRESDNATDERRFYCSGSAKAHRRHSDDVDAARHDRYYHGNLNDELNTETDPKYGFAPIRNNVQPGTRFKPTSRPYHEDRETRPFTNLIDREIETERRYGPELPKHRHNAAIPKPIVPLDDPVFSSTPWNADDDSRTPARQFEPLEPLEPLKHPRTTATSPVSTNFHDHLDDRSYLSYYKQLTPAERKQQLMAQKASLLHEQNRLRDVLHHQEALLAEKQLQLKRQQEEQQTRLQMFEKTGQFPDNGPVVTIVTKTTADAETICRTPDKVADKSRVSIGTSPIKFSERKATPTTLTSSSRSNSVTKVAASSPSPRSPVVRLKSTRRAVSSVDKERALSALEIVDSMENVATSIGEQRKHHDGHVSRSLILESSVDDAEALEESRVLEEIFFLSK